MGQLKNVSVGKRGEGRKGLKKKLTKTYTYTEMYHTCLLFRSFLLLDE